MIALLKIGLTLFTGALSWKGIIIGLISLAGVAACSFKLRDRKIYREGFRAGEQKTIKKIEKSAKENLDKRQKTYDAQKKRDNKITDDVNNGKTNLIDIL